jgi:hypothetical protein
MTLPTEPIGSIPRPLWLIEAVADREGSTAFAKVRARMLGTGLACQRLGLG